MTLCQFLDESLQTCPKSKFCLGCVYRIQVYTGEPQYSVYTGEYSRTPQMLVKIQAWLIGARVYGELPSFTEVASKPSWSTVT